MDRAGQPNRRSSVDDLERLRMRERPHARAVLRQRWAHLAFVHWTVDPAGLASLLPPGLEVDTWNGRAFVGVVPFAVQRSRAAILPVLPVLSAFRELNLRTYVHRRGRDPGVWFFSLDATSRAVVWGARALYKLAYFHAAITMRHEASGRTSFVSMRSGRGHPRFACSYEPTSAAMEVQPGTEEFFLIERYLLYSWDGSRLRSARVWHQPYEVASARVGEMTEDLLRSANIELPADSSPRVHYTERVDVRIYAPSIVRPRMSPPSAALADSHLDERRSSGHRRLVGNFGRSLTAIVKGRAS